MRPRQATGRLISNNRDILQRLPQIALLARHFSVGALVHFDLVYASVCLPELVIPSACVSIPYKHTTASSCSTNNNTSIREVCNKCPTGIHGRQSMALM